MPNQSEQIEKDIIVIMRDKGFEDMKNPQTDSASNFKEDCGMDSLDVVELIMEIEKKFNMSIPDDIEFATIGDIVRCVDERTQLR